MVETVASLLNVVATAFAAGFWWKAATVTVPELPGFTADQDDHAFDKVNEALAKSAKLNARAAACAAFAGLAGVVQLAAHLALTR